MTYLEFTRKFEWQTKKQSYTKQIDLAISICQKLFFDYEIFSKENNWGDPDLILDSITLMEKLKDSNINNDFVKERIKEIETITPNTEDFGDASYALNACVAVCEALEFLADRDPKHIYNVGICLTDTVDFKIQEEDDLTEDQINNHPLMIEARAFLIESTK